MRLGREPARRDAPPPPPAAPSSPPPPPPASPPPPTEGAPGEGFDPERTEVIAPVVDEPPISTPPTATPEAVGDTGLTRLALNRNRRRKRLRVAGRVTVALVAVLAFASTGVVWGFVRNTENSFARVDALDTESDDIVDAGGQLGDENYLIVGTDTRAGASGQLGAGTIDDAEGARSDTVMLVHIPADRSRVVAVSFPRDLDVERPECNGWDNGAGAYTDEVYDGAYGDKLNATYALGGPMCLVKVVQRISGLKINHFVGMDFAGFETMVNEIGGVEVCTTSPLEDDLLGPILPVAGRQMLDGHTALNYVRARHVESEGNGDYGRITRQQKFLSALLRGALSNQVLLNPGKLNGFVNAFTRETFVENIDTRSLITLGRSLQNVDAGAVTFITVPTSGTNDWGNEVPRKDDIQAIFRAVIDDAPLPGEERSAPVPTPEAPPAPPAPAQVQALDPREVSVEVSNASGVSGAAATAADTLAVYGFQIVSVGNYTETSTDTLVRFSPGYEAEAATLASSMPGAVLESVPGLGSTVELVLGSSTSADVVTPAGEGTELDATPSRFDEAEAAEIPADLAVVNAGDATCS
nr:LCP family protein [Rhodococcus sp. HNM0569]